VRTYYSYRLRNAYLTIDKDRNEAPRSDDGFVMASLWPSHFPLNIVRDAPRSGALSSFLIALEAWRRGLTVTLLDDRLNRIRISDGAQSITFNHSCPVSETPKYVRSTIRNKATTKERLREASVPAPKGNLLNLQDLTRESLIETARQIGYPVTIKPVDGSKGDGVYTGIRNDEELLRTFHHYAGTVRSQEMVIEEHFEGNDYRALVLGDQVLAVTKRSPANVVGDGKSSIEDLITAKNEIRKANPFLRTGLIKPDFEVEETLSSQGYTLASVPSAGLHIPLRRVANASAGGDSEDVTYTIPTAIKDAAVSAIKAVPQMRIAGVDFLYKEAETEDAKSDFTIIEMNYRPHIAVNMYPSKGKGPDVPEAIVDHFFPASSRPQSPNIHRTVFDYIAARKPLTEGVAQSVTLAPASNEGFEVARVATYSSVDITPRVARLLKLASKTNRISGSGIVSDRRLRLIAAGTLQETKSFFDTTSEALGTQPLSIQTWRGRILHGFRIHDRD